ncbi:MAG: hypothetical protein ACYCWE_19790 [Eubacteriales bacterium]
MKKASALLLLFIIIFSLSCSENTPVSEISTDTALITESAETEPEGDIPDIEKTDYEGKDFNIVYPLWSLYKNFYFAEEITGDAVNDAIYKRTQQIEEYLNIDITNYAMDYIDKILPELSKTVMAGSDTYDLALLHCATSLGNYVNDGIVLDWNKVPNIDMEKSYWNQSVKANMQLNGILPFASNNFIIPDVNSIFFNNNLVEVNNLGNIYDMVFDGKWTWDKFYEMASTATQDIDGDGNFTDQDQYGFVGEIGWQFGSITTSAGQYVLKTDASGVPQLSINTESMITLVEKIDKLVNSDNISYTWAYATKYDPNAGGIPPVSFDSGRALFYLVPLSLAKTFRETDVDFGIVPLPKLDETQKDYITLNWSGFMCVPLTAGDPSFVGNVVELLAYYNGEIVIPAFYDILLGQKISRDEDSVLMLNIIFKNNVYDLGVNLGMYSILNSVVSSPNAEFASYYAKNEKTFNKTVSDYYQAHVKYAENNG